MVTVLIGVYSSSTEPMSIQDPQDFRTRLSRLDSCVVADALDRLKLPGAVLGLHRVSTELKLVGPVLTVKLERVDGHLANRHLGMAAMHAATPAGSRVRQR